MESTPKKRRVVLLHQIKDLGGDSNDSVELAFPVLLFFEKTLDTRSQSRVVQEQLIVHFPLRLLVKQVVLVQKKRISNVLLSLRTQTREKVKELFHVIDPVRGHRIFVFRGRATAMQVASDCLLIN